MVPQVKPQNLEVPLANKRKRLECLARIHKDIMDSDLTGRVRWHEEANILRQIQGEVDYKKDGITNVVINQVRSMSTEDLLKWRSELVEKAKHYGGGNGRPRGRG